MFQQIKMGFALKYVFIAKIIKIWYIRYDEDWITDEKDASLNRLLGKHLKVVYSSQPK
jgi:hypothetical protein